MKQHRHSALLTALAVAAASVAAAPSLTAFAADGAGGYVWEATKDYQEGTDSVKDNGGTTTVTFSNVNADNVAGFCTQDGTGWDWSDYTQLSMTLKNDSAVPVMFNLALGTGAKWGWYQSKVYTTIEAGASADVSYYLKSEEWEFADDPTVNTVADLFEVHRINMMVLSPNEGSAVTGSITVSDLKLGGSASSVVEPKNGFYVDGVTLRDANQNPFVMRGTNYAYTWYSWDGQTEAALKEISGYGANCVRIVLGDGQKYTANSAGEIANLIALCEKYQLVAIFEVHDATGLDDADSLHRAATYFATTVKSALVGHENTAIINIANEWQGSTNDTAWQSAYIGAVKILRDAGLKHCIMCDAGGWGQGATTVINGGKAVLESDPEHNVMFSVHMYGTAGGNAATIKNIIDSMRTRNLCLVIGEFGFNHSDGDVDEGYIMSYCQETATGWMAWSWYGNGGGVEYLDMSSANAGGTLSANWGEVVINGKNGWKETAQKCTVFTGEQPPVVTTTTTEPATTIVTTTTTDAVTTIETIVTTSVTTTTVIMTTPAAQKQGMRGDVNEDGSVELDDAVLLCRAMASYATLTAQGRMNGDLDGVEGIGAGDLSLLLQYIAGAVEIL